MRARTRRPSRSREGRPRSRSIPRNRDAHRILGLVQAALGHNRRFAMRHARSGREAIKHLERAVSPDRHDPIAELTLGALYVDTETTRHPTLQVFLLIGRATRRR